MKQLLEWNEFYIYSLPDWAKEALRWNHTLEYLTIYLYKSFTHSNEMKKLQAGFLIKEMLDHFKSKISSTLKPDRSLWMYSGHDLTIVNVLNALNVYDQVGDHGLNIIDLGYEINYKSPTKFSGSSSTICIERVL